MMYVADVQALAHIQDLGRSGMVRAGAMDALSLQAGNLLLGNDAGAAAVEIASGGLTVSFDQDTPFCITGAIYEAMLGNKPVYSYWRYTARRGQTLKLIRAVQGVYGYLCVQGGFDVPEQAGSRSTDLASATGGFCGRALLPGDKVPLFCRGNELKRIGIAPPTPSLRIHALPSPAYHDFNRRTHSYLWQNAWTLLEGNRSVYRFSGEKLALPEKRAETPPTLPRHGAILVDDNGRPFILMADAGTGYDCPVIAYVAPADLGRLAQIRTGGKIFFQPVSEAEAVQLLRQNEIYLNQIQKIAQTQTVNGNPAQV